MLAADKVCVVLAAPNLALGCLAGLPLDLSEDLGSGEMGIGRPKRLAEITRGRFAIAN